MQKYPTPEEIKQMTTEDLQAASAAALRDRDELWERGDEDGAWNMQATVIQDIAIEIMLRKDDGRPSPLLVGVAAKTLGGTLAVAAQAILWESYRLPGVSETF